MSVDYAPIIHAENVHGCAHVLLYRRVIGWRVCGSCQQPETKTTSSSVSEAQMLMFNPFSSNIRGMRSHVVSTLASTSRFHGLSRQQAPPRVDVCGSVGGRESVGRLLLVCGRVFEGLGVGAAEPSHSWVFGGCFSVRLTTHTLIRPV